MAQCLLQEVSKASRNPLYFDDITIQPPFHQCLRIILCQFPLIVLHLLAVQSSDASSPVNCPLRAIGVAEFHLQTAGRRTALFGADPARVLHTAPIVVETSDDSSHHSKRGLNSVPGPSPRGNFVEQTCTRPRQVVGAELEQQVRLDGEAECLFSPEAARTSLVEAARCTDQFGAQLRAGWPGAEYAPAGVPVEPQIPVSVGLLQR